MSRLDQGRPSSEGSEPDYRFTLANERTFLAWMRTSLGLVAGGLAVDQFIVGLGPPGTTEVVSLGAVLLGAAVAVTGWRQWSRVQRAMRTGAPLPPSRAIPFLTVGLALLAALVAVALVLR